MVICVILTCAVWVEFLVYAIAALFVKKPVFYALVALDFFASILFTVLLWVAKYLVEVYFVH